MKRTRRLNWPTIDNRLGLLFVFSMMMAAASPDAARAQFAGGGSVFGFADACDAGGFPTGAFGVVAVTVRYTDFDLRPDLGSSQVTIGFFGGTLHYALWRRPMAEIGNFFLGGAGRSMFNRFAFAANRPQIRTVQRRVVKRIDPAGPATMENAASIVLRLRIQNFADIPGCTATMAATMLRS